MNGVTVLAFENVEDNPKAPNLQFLGEFTFLLCRLSEKSIASLQEICVRLLKNSSSFRMMCSTVKPLTSWQSFLAVLRRLFNRKIPLNMS